MKLLSSVLFLAVLVNLAASKVSNVVPSKKSHRAHATAEKARPTRDLQYRIGSPVYTTFEQLQRSSPAYQPFADYTSPSARTCCLNKKKDQFIQPVQLVQPVQPVQPVYIPVETPHCQEYQHVSVPVTSYHQVSVPYTEYHEVTVPVQHQYQYHSVQQYTPSYQSISLGHGLGHGGCGKSADAPTQRDALNAEYANPALESSALYQAIGKGLLPTYDMSRNAHNQADTYQRSGLAPEINNYAQSAQMYQNAPAFEFSRQAQYQPDGKAAYAQIYDNAGIPEMKSAQGKSAAATEAKSAAVPEMKAAAPEMNRNAAQMYQKNAPVDFGRNAAYADMAYADLNQRSALIPDFSRNAAYPDVYQRDAFTPEYGRNAYVDMYQRDAIAPEFSRNAYVDMYQRDAIAPEFSRNAYPDVYQRSIIAPEFNRNAYVDMHQRDAIAPEYSRNAYVDMHQRDAIAPEYGRNAYVDMYQRDAIAPEFSRNAYADMYQRDAIAPEFSRNAYVDMYQRNAIAPEFSRNAYADMYQRDAIAPQWSQNMMYQPDGKYTFADSHQKSPLVEGMYLRPYPVNRNAEPEIPEKPTKVEKKPAVPESKPAPAVKEDKSDSEENTSNVSAKKGKIIKGSNSDQDES